MKLLQNRIAESGKTLPVAAALGAAVWLPAGLAGQHLWLQLACFAVTVYLLVELSNRHALLRVRSRMVSVAFIALSCMGCTLFPSLAAGLVQLGFVAALLLLLQTYQDPAATGLTYYGFLALGMASMVFVPTLYYVPLLWLLMATQLQSLSLRTWLASLLGLLTPYWLSLVWLVYMQDFQPLLDHFAALAEAPARAAVPLGSSKSLAVVWVFTLLLTVGGIVLFWQRSYEEKIRIRLVYGLFATLAVVTLLAAVLLPRHFAVLMRLSFVFASPLIAHAATFTHSRLSNIVFFAVLAIALGITVVNLLSL